MDYDALEKRLREPPFGTETSERNLMAAAAATIAELRARNDALVKAGHGLNGILGTAESNASGMPNWEFVSARINAFRAALAANREW